MDEQRLGPKILSLWVRNLLAIDANRKLRSFKTSCDFNIKYYGASIFFIYFKMVRPNTNVGCSYIKKMDTTNMSQFNHDASKTNIQVVSWI